MSTVLDSTVVIDVLRGSPEALEYLTSLSQVPVCSEITRVEIIRGLRSRERGATERLFHTLRWEPVGEVVARAAGEFGREYRRSHPGISSADLLIAATASQLGLKVATTNVRRYPMFPRLRPPY
ncbi:MAG: type II toxin-antitoxin system VapC family toxin [Actinomycetota bacterium]